MLTTGKFLNIGDGEAHADRSMRPCSRILKFPIYAWITHAQRCGLVGRLLVLPCKGELPCNGDCWRPFNTVLGMFQFAFTSFLSLVPRVVEAAFVGGVLGPLLWLLKAAIDAYHPRSSCTLLVIDPGRPESNGDVLRIGCVRHTLHVAHVTQENHRFTLDVAMGISQYALAVCVALLLLELVPMDFRDVDTPPPPDGALCARCCARARRAVFRTLAYNGPKRKRTMLRVCIGAVIGEPTRAP